MAEDVISELTTLIRRFAQRRDWEQFHTPKNLSMALVVEAGEIVELFQWKTAEESMAQLDDPDTKAAIESEIADVAIYLLRLADVAGVDLAQVVRAKMAVNEGRFPAG